MSKQFLVIALKWCVLPGIETCLTKLQSQRITTLRYIIFNNVIFEGQRLAGEGELILNQSINHSINIDI